MSKDGTCKHKFESLWETEVKEICYDGRTYLTFHEFLCLRLPNSVDTRPGDMLEMITAVTCNALCYYTAPLMT